MCATIETDNRCCGTLDTNIAIRTLLAEKNRLYCWAGGAIIADSEVEAEYQETFDKLNKILPLLKFGELRNRKLA